jgi:hypothetical protein
MTKMVKLLGIVAVVMFLGAFIYFRVTAQADKEHADEQMARLDTEMRAQNSAIQADIDESKARLITLKLGAVEGLEFRRCKVSPPKLEENRAKCQRYDEYLKKWNDEEKQHPTW